MIVDIKLEFCPVCNEDTDYLQGTFKSKVINGELFHLNATMSELMKKK